MSERDTGLYLEDILNSIKKIKRYLKDFTLKDVMKNEMLQDALVRNIEIIEEATKHIPKEMRGKYQEIKWKEIVGMRNKIAHDYFGTDLKLLWRTIHDDLPIYKKIIKELLNEYDGK